MIELQTTPILPDVLYGLDSMYERNEIDAITHMTVKFYMPRERIRAHVDGDEPFDGTMGRLHYRRHLRQILTDESDLLLAQLDSERRAAIVHAGLMATRLRVHDLAECMSGWAIEDEVVGGCMKPWKRGRRTKWNLRWEPNPRMARKLHAPGWIRRYARGCNPDASHLRAEGSRVIRLASGLSLDAVQGAAERLHAELRAQHDGYRQTNARVRQSFLPRIELKDRRARKRRRAVVKRAAATAIELIGADAVRIFAQGGVLRLKGRDIDVEVARGLSLDTVGHSGLNVSIVTADTGAKLCDACVYHPETPALDQLVAFSLAMEAGEERDIIETANLFNIQEAALTHPVIAERAKTQYRAPRLEPEVDPMKARRQRYWQETKHLWVEALGVYVLGRLWNRKCGYPDSCV